MLPLRPTSSTTPTKAAAATHAARAAAPGLPWPIVAACAALTTDAHTLIKAMARARAAAALLPADASQDLIDAVAARMGRVQSERPAAALAWASDYAQALAALDAPPAPVVVTPPAAPAPAKYRHGQRHLFQRVSESVIPPRIQGQAGHPHDVYGPTHRYVDFLTGWPWDRLGSDWTDADGVRYGPTPWLHVLTQTQTAPMQPPQQYSADATAVVQHCQSADRWLALLLTAPNAQRTIAGPKSPQAPVLVVTFEDGGIETLRPWVCAEPGSTSDRPMTQQASISLPAFVEFERPTKPVQAAHLAFTVLEHYSGARPEILGFLLDPPMNADPVQHGVAATVDPLDAGITKLPGIIGAHRYLDGTDIADFVLPGGLSYHDEATFDPAIWGGARDTSKLPHLGYGRWTNTSLQDGSNNWSLVGSDHAGDGFAPLAPGLGAMRIRMPAGLTPGDKQPVVDGSIVGSSGTQATTAMLWLPERGFGRLDRIFVRYYFRLGMPHGASKANRKQVRHETGQNALWTTMAGKFGITPTHANSYGGVSGSSGGPYGWQMRHSWYECDAEQGGPDEGGIAAGHHLYDYLYQNPQGHNYGGPNGTPEQERWGQRGGLGGMLYAGHWYCIETELDLNTISDAAPGFVPDGALRTWVDGRLVWERTGMVFRSGPVYNPGKAANKRRPARELGVTGLWLDWFHGGKTLATFDRVSFYTGLAYGTEYIGPMRLT